MDEQQITIMSVDNNEGSALKPSFTTLADMDNETLVDAFINSVDNMIPIATELQKRFREGERDARRQLKVPIRGCHSWAELCTVVFKYTPQGIGKAIRKATQPKLPPAPRVPKQLPSTHIDEPENTPDLQEPDELDTEPNDEPEEPTPPSIKKQHDGMKQNAITRPLNAWYKKHIPALDFDIYGTREDDLTIILRGIKKDEVKLLGKLIKAMKAAAEKAAATHLPPSTTRAEAKAERDRLVLEMLQNKEGGKSTLDEFFPDNASGALMDTLVASLNRLVERGLVTYTCVGIDGVYEAVTKNNWQEELKDFPEHGIKRKTETSTEEEAE
jgi:hypothetical protein